MNSSEQLLTLINSITQVAFPLLAVYEKHEWIDVRPADTTSDNCRATDNRQVLENEKISMRVQKCAS